MSKWIVCLITVAVLLLSAAPVFATGWKNRKVDRRQHNSYRNSGHFDHRPMSNRYGRRHGRYNQRNSGVRIILVIPNERVTIKVITGDNYRPRCTPRRHRQIWHRRKF